MGRARGDSRVAAWVETLALQFARVGGLPLIAGRIVGWLMVCEPEAQSAEEIAEAIGASRASLSTNLRLLEAAGMVSVSTRPRGRIRYYRIEDSAWEATVRMQIAALGEFINIADQGATLLGEKSRRSRRIRAARSVFRWMVDVFERAPAFKWKDD